MRGIVMDIKNGRAVVFQKNGDIVEVKDNGYQIGQTIKPAVYPNRNFIALAACFILVFIAGISGYTAAYRTPTDYIYVDINPSVRLDVNCFDKVISVVPLNHDASVLMENYPIRTADTEQCIYEIVYACREKDYLNDKNGGIEINVVTNKSSLNNSVYKASERLKSDNWKVSVRNVDEEENKLAMKYGASPKRLKAVKNYTEAFGGTLEDNFAALKGITNREIYAKIKDAGNSENRADSEPPYSEYQSTPNGLSR